jgi:hypothetical protein
MFAGYFSTPHVLDSAYSNGQIYEDTSKVQGQLQGKGKEGS